MFDTHCHPQFSQYDKDREEIIAKALGGGIKIICVGTDFEMSQKAIALASQYDGMWASVGLHPNDDLKEGFDVNKYRRLAEHPKVVAIGEIGLDYYRTPDLKQQKIQQQRFLEQINLATEANKPAIIHCRNAHEDMLDIISRNPDLQGVIHSFTGTPKEAIQYINLGFHIGFNGIITFTHDYDEAVKQTPLEKILTETDAPYLTPIPHRGQRNEPSYVKFVIQKIAEIKNIGIDEVAGTTAQNALELFSLKT